MENKGHTPGPWTVRTLENFGFNVVHYNGGDKFDIMRVAKCADEANARLIAAAPDLLKACSDWIEWLKPDSPWREDAAQHEERMLDAMRAAIQRATEGGA